MIYEIQQVLRLVVSDIFRNIIHYSIKLPFRLMNIFNEQIDLSKITPKTILIIRKDNLGDLILTLPAIKTIKLNFPNSKLVVLINYKNKDAVKGLDFIDEIIFYESDKKWSLKQTYKVFKLLRKLNPDMSIDLQYGDTLEMALLAWLLRIKIRIGCDVGQHGILFTHAIKPNKKQQYELDYVFDLLRLFNFKKITKELIHLTINKSALSQIDKFFKDKSGFKVYMSPIVSSTNKLKEWPKERFAFLADKIINNLGANVVFSSTKQDASSVLEVISNMKNKPLNYGLTSFEEFVALINSCDLVITNNTGTMHVASSLSKPTIIINGPSSVIRWNPKNTKLHTTISKNLPCSFFDCDYCWRKDHACLDWISVDEVFKITKNKIEEIKCQKYQ